MKFKSIEILVTLFVFTIMSVVIGKYAVVYLTGKDIAYNFERLAIHWVNSSYSRKLLPPTYKNYELRKSNDDVWRLYSNGAVSDDYVIASQDEKLTIAQNSKNAGKKLDVQINGVRDYYSNSGFILTEIPDRAEGTFSISEQEDYLPIFGYHNVFLHESDIVDPHIDMTKEKFMGQVELLNKSLNCKWYSLSTLVNNYMSSGLKIPRNACVITFDEGRKNNYEVVLPILNDNGMNATFFIISGRVGQKSYMNNWQVSALFRAGNSIGSHSLTGGSLIETSWYPNGLFGKEELWQQINDSRLELESFGYPTDIFAYPLGDYDEAILDDIKSAGYSAARASKKGSSWKDQRSIATGFDDNFRWQLNYYEPELMYDAEIIKAMKYTGKWQFEEGYRVKSDVNGNIKVLSSTTPTDSSYEVIALEDALDSIENSFVVSEKGDYALHIFASNLEFASAEMSVSIDGNELSVESLDKSSCLTSEGRVYCDYVTRSQLDAGRHTIVATSKAGKTILDSFRILKTLNVQNTYSLSIRED